jgi:hypothetical protein
MPLDKIGWTKIIFIPFEKPLDFKVGKGIFWGNTPEPDRNLKPTI